LKKQNRNIKEKTAKKYLGCGPLAGAGRAWCAARVHPAPLGTRSPPELRAPIRRFMRPLRIDAFRHSILGWPNSASHYFFSFFSVNFKSIELKKTFKSKNVQI
jgi:hypothetical protein